MFEPLDRLQKLKKPRMTEAKLWLAFAMIGFCVALIAFGIMLIEEFLLAIKGEVFQYLTVNQ